MTLRKKASAKERGFTLLEIVISLGFFTVIGGLVSGSVFQTYKTNADTGARVDLGVQTALATRWISRDVYRSSSTSIVDGAAPVSTGSLSWYDDSLGTDVTCSYAINGTDLERDCGSGAKRIATGISGLQFSRDGLLVTAAFSVTATKIGGPTLVEPVNLSVAMGGG